MEEDSHINNISNFDSDNEKIKNAGWQMRAEKVKTTLRNVLAVTVAMSPYGQTPTLLSFGARTEKILGNISNRVHCFHL